MLNYEQKVKNTNSNIRVFLIVVFILNLVISILVSSLFIRLSVILMLLDLLILAIYIVHLMHVSLMFKIDFKTSINLIISYYKLEHQLIDARIFYQKNARVSENNELIAQVPRYFFRIRHDQIYLCVENSIKFTNQLDDLDVSSALSDLVVDSKYKSSDSTYMIFELEKADAEQLKFNTLSEFVHFSISKRNSFKIDSKNILKGHVLISGKTGSGKSYAIFNLLIQMLVQKINVKIIDPKNSDLSAISEISNIDCATNADLAVDMIKDYRNLMNKRKIEMNQLLKDNLASDFSDFNMTANYLVIDELAALQMMLNKEQKAEFNSLLAEIILQGRQMGFFVLVAMQQASAQLISTNIREQFNSVIILGNSEKQTYVTGFGMGVDVPVRKIEQGAGWLKKDTNESVKYIFFPILNFDLTQAFDRIANVNSVNVNV